MSAMDNAPSPSIKDKIITGAAWMMAIKWSSRLMGLVSTMVLARLLTPADFGLVAIAMGLIGIIDAFFDFGFDLALIKNKKATREDYDVVWSLRLVNMLAFGLIVALISPLVAQYANAPEVTLVCLVLALSIALRGCGNVGTIDFQKEMDFVRVFKFSFFPRIISVITTIVLAVIFRSYWAIILGALIKTLYTITFSYSMSPFRPRLRFRGASHIWSFSRWILLGNMSRQLFNAMDRFLLAGLIGKSQLGLYNVAGNLASIVTIELMTPVGSALMPGFAKLQFEPERLRSAFLQSLTVLIALTVPASVGVWLVAPELVRVLLGHQWEGAMGFVALFGFFYMFFSLSETLSSFMAMVGLINRSAVISLIRTIAFLAGFYFVFHLQGLEGVIYLKILLGGIEFMLLFEISRRFVRLPALTLLQTIWRPVAAAVAMALAVTHLPLQGISSPLLLLLTKSVAGALAYIVVSLLLWLAARKPHGLESLVRDQIHNKLAMRASTQ